MFLLLRKGQFGQKLEKKVEIFLIFVLIFLRFKKAISYHQMEKNLRYILPGSFFLCFGFFLQGLIFFNLV